MSIEVVLTQLSNQKLKWTLVLPALQIKEDDVYYQADSCVRGPGGVGPLLPPAGGWVPLSLGLWLGWELFHGDHWSHETVIVFRPCFVFSSVVLSNLLLLDTRCFAPTQLCTSGRRCAALAPWPHPPGSSALRCGEAGSELHHLRNHSCLQNGPNVYVWSLSGMESPAHTLHQLVAGLDNYSIATMVTRSHYTTEQVKHNHVWCKL